MPDNATDTREIELTRIASARGIFFPTAEVFGPMLGGLWDYGPIGWKIFNNILKEWRAFLDEYNVFEISGSVLLPRKVLQASGHEDNFSDPLATCKKCKAVYRVDKLLSEKDPSGVFEGLSAEKYFELMGHYNLKCTKCGGELGIPEKFSLMVGTKIGVTSDINAYLRPEACQSIYLDFKRIFDTYAGRKLPVSIAQVGKAFRNEISPRNNLLRQREFYQNDIEVFFTEDGSFALNLEDDIAITVSDAKNPNINSIKISDALKSGIIESKITAYWTAKWIIFLQRIGFSINDIRLKKLHDSEKPFYAKEAFDLEIRKDNDWVEVSGIHYRNDYDMLNYEKFGATVPKYEGKLPNVFEVSCGTDRLFYLMLYNSLKIEDERHWFKLSSNIAPYSIAVFPLQKDEKLSKKGNEVYQILKKISACYYSETGSIGKRYAKADEIGVPRCITIDYQSLEDNTVTIRNRDDTKQTRVKIGELA
jgi:glycyl-tRNA synthetase